MARQTTTVIDGVAVDDPLRQDSEYRFDSLDRQYIDSQIRGCERHLVDSLLSGVVCTWQEVDSTSGAVSVGDAVVPTAIGKVSKATAALLAAAGSAGGIAVTTAAPGAKVRVAIGGRVPNTVTGLAAAAAGFARVNTTTARLEKVTAYAVSDWPTGIIDAEGSLLLTVPLSQGGTVAGTGLPAGTANQLLQHDGTQWAPVSGISAARITSGTLNVDRGGTGFGTWTKGDLLYCTATNILAKLAMGTTGQVLRATTGGNPAWAYLSSLYDAAGTNTVDIGAAATPYTGQVIALTADGGYAIRMTNKTGAASVKGTVLKLDDTWRITGETTPNQLSNASFDGADWDHSDGGRLYLTVTIPGGAATVSAYSNSGRTTKVAEGTLAIGGNAGGTVTLSAVGGSGVTGTVTIVASAVQDLTPQADQGSDRGVMLCSPTTAGAPYAGIMYSDGVADGSDVWVVRSGLAYVLTKANLALYPIPAGAYLYLPNGESAADYGKAAWEPARTAGNYDAAGIGRSVSRIATGSLMLCEIDFVGVGPTS